MKERGLKDPYGSQRLLVFSFLGRQAKRSVAKALSRDEHRLLILLYIIPYCNRLLYLSLMLTHRERDIVVYTIYIRIRRIVSIMLTH